MFSLELSPKPLGVERNLCDGEIDVNTDVSMCETISLKSQVKQNAWLSLRIRQLHLLQL